MGWKWRDEDGDWEGVRRVGMGIGMRMGWESR